MMLAVTIALITGILLIGQQVWATRITRRALDVWSDLQDEVSTPEPRERKNNKEVAGSSEGREKSLSGLVALLCAVLAGLMRNAIGHPGVHGTLVTALFGLSAGYIGSRMVIASKKKRKIRAIEFFLPMVMERVVMGVQAGLDVMPTLKALVELEMKEAIARGTRMDPVTVLLDRVVRLVEAGLGFEESLREVAFQIDSRPLRHAFIHLGLAQKEGGELVAPLRELSDSTQLYFQETIEEDIAKMPVKATFPLLLTFAGLILCFLTSPLIQILSLTARAMPK